MGFVEDNKCLSMRTGDLSPNYMLVPIIWKISKIFNFFENVMEFEES